MNMQALVARLGGIRGIGGDTLTPMTTGEIDRLENELGCHFQEAYRDFLATYGASRFEGESPDNPFVLFRSLEPMPPQFEGDKGILDALYGGQKDEIDPYSIRVRVRCFAGRMPESMIPIGDDGGAGQICLGIKGDQAGKVYYWDQSNEPLKEEQYLKVYGAPRPPEVIFQNVRQIAESFEDFLLRLEFMEE